jgi:hypothetical protein
MNRACRPGGLCQSIWGWNGKLDAYTNRGLTSLTSRVLQLPFITGSAFRHTFATLLCSFASSQVRSTPRQRRHG